jgi:fatty-acyl-CoA synthase
VPLLIGDLVADAADMVPSAPAATLAGRSLTYRELHTAGDRHAANLAAAGATPGRTLVWWSGPDLRSLAGFVGAARLGAVFAPLNPAFGSEEAARAIAYLRPALIVVDEAHEDRARQAGGGTPVATLAGLERMGETRTGPPPGESDAHIVYLTSGTTGEPKGVVVSHRASWLRSFPGGSTFASGLHGDGGVLASFPLFHYGGWHYVLEAWHHRTAYHLAPRFDGATLVEVAARWEPTAMYCIPAVWNRVLDAAGPEDLRSVRHADTGTSAAPPALVARLRHAMPQATTSILYGSSEGGHHTTLHDRDVLARPGSVGRAAPGGVIRLSDSGEILYRSPMLMTSYLDRPEETAAALAGGWYRTGDLGSFDADGFLYITGRVREMIRSGGEYVAPAEVEQALAGLAGVEDLAVVGLADETWGEVVCAAVVLAEGAEPPTVERVRRHLEGRLAAFKHPRAVRVVPAIARTPATGQVQRTLLKQTLEMPSDKKL